MLKGGRYGPCSDGDHTKFDRGYVWEPFIQDMHRCQSNLHTGLSTAELLAKLPKAEMHSFEWPFIMSFDAGGKVLEREENQDLFRQWVLLKAFGDLHKCLRSAMERLYVVKTICAELTSDPNLNVVRRERLLRRTASHLALTKLFVGKGTELKFQQYLQSFNLARNCLEHTDGIVTVEHCNNAAKDKLLIYGIRFGVVVKRDDIESIHKLDEPIPPGAKTRLGAEPSKIEFDIGQQIRLSMEDFSDVLNGCLLTGLDILMQIPA